MASPLRDLVLFMTGLAVFGMILAGVHYTAVDIPAQKDVQPPANYIPGDPGACARCIAECQLKIYSEKKYTACMNGCMKCACGRWECTDR